MQFSPAGWQEVAFQDLPQKWGLEEQQSFPAMWLLLSDSFDINAPVDDLPPTSDDQQAPTAAESEGGALP